MVDVRQEWKGFNLCHSVRMGGAILSLDVSDGKGFKREGIGF